MRAVRRDHPPKTPIVACASFAESISSEQPGVLLWSEFESILRELAGSNNCVPTTAEDDLALPPRRAPTSPPPPPRVREAGEAGGDLEREHTSPSDAQRVDIQRFWLGPQTLLSIIHVYYNNTYYE